MLVLSYPLCFANIQITWRIRSLTTTSRSIERFASDDGDDSTHDGGSERAMLDSRGSPRGAVGKQVLQAHTQRTRCRTPCVATPDATAGPGPCFCMRLYGPNDDLAGDAFQEMLIGEEHRNRWPSAQTRRTQ